MKKAFFYKATFLAIGLLMNCIFVFGQNKVAKIDSSTYDYAVLKYLSSNFKRHLSVYYNDSDPIDLRAFLKIEKDTDEIFISEHKLIFAGIKYLDAQGYELISSLASGYAKEYIFRRKRTNNR